MTTDEDVECEACMWEARARYGIYMDGDTVPRNLRKKIAEAYEDEHYTAHEAQIGATA